MEITRESLAARYADLADAPLLHRLRSGALTELAKEVAIAEATRRGLDWSRPPEPVSDPEPALVPIDESVVVIEPDHFETNPYQAPRAHVRFDHSTVGWTVQSMAWWMYIVLLAALTLNQAYHHAETGDPFRSFGARLVIELASIAGLVGWRLHRAWLSPYLWLAVAAVLAAFMVVTLKQIVVFASGPYGPDSRFAAGMLGLALALLLPQVWGLLRYALFSGSVWRTRG
ncbi:hypothetical protein [Tahibacter amnicola]|uniref:Uncharacterized protein n=1 Tax=Tahibacter amnicola TaxID=2976241 RepID=A0ABY6BNK9_9GAMM|nr:hypothetical protein [Tahibacter amnicola]UXI70151.1 hypothetical protein N4264_11120 [Tahibacter amnicola]